MASGERIRKWPFVYGQTFPQYNGTTCSITFPAPQWGARAVVQAVAVLTADAAVADLGNNLENSNETACANALDMADFTCAACHQLLLHPVVVSLDRSKFI